MLINIALEKKSEKLYFYYIYSFNDLYFLNLFQQPIFSSIVTAVLMIWTYKKGNETAIPDKEYGKKLNGK